MSALTPNLDQSTAFLEMLDPAADAFTFQAFDDNEELKRGHLAKVVHGSLDDHAARLTAWQKGGAGIFVTVNATDGMGRKKANITRARAVFVDLDGAPLQPVLACPLEPHVIVEPSPGRWHAYWIVDGLTLDQFEGVQKALVARFNGDSACVDCSRVMRLPGFLHQKQEGRPFMTRIHGLSDRLPYTAEATLAEFPPAKAGYKVNGHGDAGEDRKTSDLIRAITTGEEYHPALLRLAWRYASAGWSRTQIINALQGFMDARSERDGRWGARRKQIPMLVDTAISKQESERDAQDQPAQELLDRLAAEQDDDEAVEIKGDSEFDLSHDGLALDMGRQWARRARHVALWGKWLFWTGRRWEPDERLIHMTRCRDYLRRRADDLVRNAAKIWPDLSPDKAVERAEAIAKQLRSEPMRANVTSMARSNAELVATVAQWDAGLSRIGTPDGTIDLRTGTLRPASPADFITKLTSVAPAPPGTPAPIWQAFLERIFRHDPELVPFIQRAVGYSLLGEIRDHVVLFCWGQGGNGKGVLLNTVSRILGDYAAVAPSDLLLATTSDRHPCDMAMLRGARFVTCQELGPNRAWDEPKLKSLTGGDPITARFMRQDFFTYEPQFTLWVAGNHKPSFRGVDEAIKRRVLLAPFLQVIPSEERDLDLPEKLRAEHPAILRWMIDGCLAYQREGLKPPATALAATKAYLDAEDTLGQWLEERCVQHHKIDWTALKSLYVDWSAWCGERGQRPGTARTLSKALDERGLERQRRTPGEGFCGVGLANVGNVGSSDNTRMGASENTGAYYGANLHNLHRASGDDPDAPDPDDLEFYE